MRAVKMDETFSAAVRGLLVDQVEEAATQRWWTAPARRWIAGVGSVLVLAAGGGIAYGTGAFTTPPGGDELTPVGAPVSATGTGTQVVQLGAQPDGTTAIAISFACLTPGSFTFTDGATVTCSIGDVAAMQQHPATYTMPVTPGADSTTITSTPNARWRLTAAYVTVKHTPWAVNANGETYGVINEHGMPDLVAVIATNGRTGYVHSKQFMWGPSGTPPANPTVAVAENGRTRTLTVYESDGKTPIGKFIIGRGTSTSTH